MEIIIDELIKKPETFKEKLEDLWDDITNYYPSKIKDGLLAIKRFFRNLRKYWGILWSDNDFDHGYMEELIITKLTYMADYFRTARIVTGAEETYHKINLALRIGKIAFDINPEECSPEDYGGRFGFDYIGYINTRNYKRFWPIKDPSIFEDSPEDNKRKGLMFRNDLREKKARKIFYEILSQYSETWWD